MGNSHLNATCPYCNTVFSTISPPSAGKPTDIECVPYTRDIGRFDPLSENDWYNSNGWSRIGKDFMSWLNWERIGILRLNRPNLDIRYRVQGCPSCKCLFDMYANYSGVPLKDIWPHLFSRNHRHPDLIEPYYGNSWIMWLISMFGRVLKLNEVGAIVFGLLIFGLSFCPWLINRGSIYQALPSSMFTLTLLVRGTATLGIILALILIYHYVKFIEQITGFKELLAILQERGLIHWRNFTLCRLVGVQDGKGLPNLNQNDIILGGITIFVVTFTWSIAKLGWSILAYELITVVVFTSLSFATHNLSNRFEKNIWLKYSKKIFIIFFLVGVLAIVLIKWLTASPFIRWDILNTIFDLLFWLFAFYILGTALWIGMKSTVYILKGLSKIPMNLNPYNKFANSRPLRKLQNLSSSLMLVAFITLTAIVTILIVFGKSQSLALSKEMLSSPNWIFNYLICAVGLIFSFLGIGLKRIAFLYISIFYVAIILLISDVTLKFSNIEFDGQLIVVTVFFTSLLIYHFFATDEIIRKLLINKKENALHELVSQVEFFQKMLSGDNQKIDPTLNVTNQSQFTEDRTLAIKNIERLCNIIKDIEKVSIYPNIAPTAIKFTGPFVSALIINYIMSVLF